VTWQPIKSAPSGERVLVCDRYGNVFVVRLLVLRWYDDAEKLIDRPEWWMALPKGPKAEGKPSLSVIAVRKPGS
jgi:hypothetical protein